MTEETLVADDWENADDSAVEAIEKRFQQVKIMQRKQKEKDEMIEKSKAGLSEGDETAANLNGPIVVTKVDNDSVAEGPGPSQDEPRRILLRRPKENASSSSLEDGSQNSETTTNRGRRQNNDKSKKKQPQTLEERQAAYKEAKDRIMGSEYKPDNAEIKEITVVERSKSPETISLPRAPQHFDIDFSNGMSIPPPVPPGYGPMQPQPRNELNHVYQSDSSDCYMKSNMPVQPESLYFYLNTGMQNGFTHSIQAPQPPQHCYSFPQQIPPNHQFDGMSVQCFDQSNQNFAQMNYMMNQYSGPPPPQIHQMPPQNCRPPMGTNGRGCATPMFQHNQNYPGMYQQNQRQRNDPPLVSYNFPPPSQRMPPSGSNPIPFGCPPMSVNQYSKSSNTGPGILGPPPPFSMPPPPPQHVQQIQNRRNQNFKGQPQPPSQM